MEKFEDGPPPAERAHYAFEPARPLDDTRQLEQQVRLDSGTDAEPPTPTRSIVYASKFPPSSSAIGLYAEAFCAAIERYGPVARVRFPPEPHDTQKLRIAIRWFLRGLRTSSAESTVHVELAGRSLAEFFFVVGLLVRRRPPHVSLTCHDVPSVVGPVFLFRVFDRRGLRRLPMAASRALGRRLETWVLRRSRAVCTLTDQGAAVLAETYGCRVVSLGLIALPEPHTPKQPQVFVPGYLARSTPLKDIVQRIAAAPETPLGPWTVVFGAGDDATIATVLSTLSSEGKRIARYTGQLDEKSLVAEYHKSAIVLRIVDEAQGNRFAASGPLGWAASSACVTITNDTRPGASELAALGLVEFRSDYLTALDRALSQRPPFGLSVEQRQVVIEHFGPATVAERWNAAVTGKSSTTAPERPRQQRTSGAHG